MYKKITLLVSTCLLASSTVFAETKPIEINQQGVKQVALTDEAQTSMDAKKEKMMQHRKERAEKKKEVKGVKKKYREEMKEEKQAHKAKMKELRENMKSDVKSIKGQADSQAQ